MITINNLEEMKKYYDEKANVYIFSDDLTLMFDVDVDSDIVGYDITARNIDAYNIKAWDITALDIKAWDITADYINVGNIFYYSICIARDRFKCKSVNSYRKNAVHKCLNQEIEYI